MKFDLWVGCELVPKAGHSFKRGPLDQGEGAGAPRDFTHLEAVEQHKLDHLDPQTKKWRQPWATKKHLKKAWPFRFHFEEHFHTQHPGSLGCECFISRFISWPLPHLLTKNPKKIPKKSPEKCDQNPEISRITGPPVTTQPFFFGAHGPWRSWSCQSSCGPCGARWRQWSCAWNCCGGRGPEVHRNGWRRRRWDGDGVGLWLDHGFFLPSGYLT